MSRRQRADASPSGTPGSDPGANPRRTADLYAPTPEGYLIAQDIACQYLYTKHAACPDCGGSLRVAAHIDRAGEGLNELLCQCAACGSRSSVLFDVSNEVFQAWLGDLLGDLYTRHYAGPPRTAARP